MSYLDGEESLVTLMRRDRACADLTLIDMVNLLCFFVKSTFHHTIDFSAILRQFEARHFFDSRTTRRRNA